MKRIILSVFITALSASAVMAERVVPFGSGRLRLRTVAPNAVRIQYFEGMAADTLPDWVYVNGQESSSSLVSVETSDSTLSVNDAQGRTVFVATAHRLKPATVAGMPTHEALLAFRPGDGGTEYQYGLGQFQDGYCNVKGLSRRLTQVNTQISIPMLISSKGYGILWNNYGLTDFNPCDHSVALQQRQGSGRQETVSVTSTEGGRQEVRERYVFEGTLDIAEEGDYALLLDVGQKMARRHHLVIDGTTVIEMQNVWLPPTASCIVSLKAGRHHLTAELSKGDAPVLHYGRVKASTVLRSPVAQCVDYTVFVGTPDEIISTYRQLTGVAPLMPRWALGYIHCRERFHSSGEILQTARRFRQEQLPVDVIVQDWQYWGKHGWNSMTFDEDHYPDPKALTDSLHQMGMRLMLSVWSKIDRHSEVGRQMARGGHYIPGTDWVDFFNPASAAAYWQHFSQRLLPLGIDAWWQDATEPENDDLQGRRVWAGRYPGELFRNVYPLLVNKTVYEGLLRDQPSRRPMILTRCGFPGIQRYGAAMWSGDVGNDWVTLRRQITAGLGMQAAGIPWWTYDAGGFFRPAGQYTDSAYIHRMLRWIETSVFLPLMRVHGYMSDTEPWRYGQWAQRVIASCLKERYRLLPYIYSEAAAVTFEGSTLMRPLVFDFPDDEEALRQSVQYMFGRSLLVCPVVEPDVTSWRVYLPRHAAGWYDYYTRQHYAGGQYVTVSVDATRIPVFVRAGSIIPVSDAATPLVFPGADAVCTVYDDDGCSRAYERGEYRRTVWLWDDSHKQLTRKQE